MRAPTDDDGDDDDNGDTAEETMSTKGLNGQLLFEEVMSYIESSNRKRFRTK